MPPLSPLIVLGLAACGGMVADPGPGLEPPALFQKILDDSSRANHVIGLQAAVLIPGQAPWYGVTGEERPGVPMRADRLLSTGSISKLYTAVAAMILIDRGRFGLDDRIGRWFPSVPNVNPDVTVRQLLQHTSGLRDFGSAPNFSEAFADPQREWTMEEMLAFVGPPLFPPGTGWEASNTNRILLGIMVERESGMSLGAFMRTEIFKGSAEAWLSGDGPPPAALGTMWTINSAGTRINATERFTPALLTLRREVQATAGEVARFGQMLFTGDLLTAGMRVEMEKIVPDDGKIAGQTGGGLGIRAYNYLGRSLFGHSGATNNGTSLFLFDPATKIVVAVSVNQDGGSHNQSHFRTAPALLKAAIASVEK